jgi:hypothetical protein
MVWRPRWKSQEVSPKGRQTHQARRQRILPGGRWAGRSKRCLIRYDYLLRYYEAVETETLSEFS